MFFIGCQKTDATTTATGATITTINCTSAAFSGTAIINVDFSGSATIAYTGGKGDAYTAGSSVSSTGVTGLTATLSAGTLASAFSGSILA